jgi:hypothetical protein
VGSTCIICKLKDPSREHVSRHFMKELMDIVSQLEDQQQCPECKFRCVSKVNLFLIRTYWYLGEK